MRAGDHVHKDMTPAVPLPVASLTLQTVGNQRFNGCMKVPIPQVIVIGPDIL